MNEPRYSWMAAHRVVVGAAALVLGAVHKAAGPFVKPPPIEQVIQEKAKSFYERALEAIQGVPEPQRRPPPPQKKDLTRLLAAPRPDSGHWPSRWRSRPTRGGRTSVPAPVRRSLALQRCRGNWDWASWWQWSLWP